ncbi:MAG: hypothetical protein JSU01_22065 [Bacteroidetes bacterium]|nr:hypothetical protein [Bacteroidota bacterium]
MRKFIKKAFLFSAPLIVATISYLVTDPYQSMPWHRIHEFNILMLSRGDISTKLYLRNADRHKYDSFIFGSSRSTAHTAAEWKKYLPKGSSPFSFSAWNESVEGIYRRVKLIDSLKKPIHNAFIVIDLDRAFHLDKISWDHYLITGISKYQYYTKDYLNYLQSPKLILSSIDYAIFHKQRGYMDGFVGMKPGDLDTITNDWDPRSDEKIDTDSANYYRNSLPKFYRRPTQQQVSKALVTDSVLYFLNQIELIFNRHKTNYKVVIAPLYDQIKINPTDLKQLDDVFGQENVFDYSGINAITNNKFNYGSDILHYRKKVGNLIFKEVYR